MSPGGAYGHDAGVGHDFLQAFAQTGLNEMFEGAKTASLAEVSQERATELPLLNLVQSLLSPTRGFIEPLSRIYGCALDSHVSQSVLIQGMRISGRFLNDSAYREDALESFCKALLDQPALLVFYPPPILWGSLDADARFRLHGTSDKDLLLCMLLGTIGFAQLCDDMLKRAIPLLVRPWSPEKGLLKPERLPSKSYSQTLCVERVGPRRLLLFDKYCSQYQA